MHAVILANLVLFLSTLSLRRATNPLKLAQTSLIISIHALLAESDHLVTLSALTPKQFLSTLSLRRATRFRSWLIPCNRNFYPRSPCGERPIHARIAYTAPHFYPRSPCGERLCANIPVGDLIVISIHALLAESDRRT